MNLYQSLTRLLVTSWLYQNKFLTSLTYVLPCVQLCTTSNQVLTTYTSYSKHEKIKNEGEHKDLTTILQRLDGNNNNFRDNYPKPSSLLPLKSLQTLITLS